MSLTGLSEFNELHIMHDKKIDFYSVICLHRFGRGPALGGCRFVEYGSHAQAIEEAIRLSNAMSYKAAVSGLPHDGGKAIIVRPKKLPDRELLLKKFAQFVDSLNGNYITTIDSGTCQADMSIVKKYTSFVTGELDQDNDENNPSVSTALGLYASMQRAALCLLGRRNLQGVHIAIQGVGNVGHRLAQLLHAEGAQLTVCDINANTAAQCAKALNAHCVAPDDIYDIECDIFSPCGLGQIINPTTLNRFKTKIIAGAANDQLLTDDLSQALSLRGIIYLPDFVINAGGLVHLSLQLQKKPLSAIQQAVLTIAERVQYLIEQAQLNRTTLYEIAKGLAQEQLRIF